MKKLIAGMLILMGMMAVLLPQAKAESVTYYFYPLAFGVPSDYYSPTSHLQLVLADDPANNAVSFTFSNLLVSPAAGEITSIYFYGNVLSDSGISISNPPGVDFSIASNPGKLPGGQKVGIPVNSNTTVTAERGQPSQGNKDPGINPGEYLTITFKLGAEKTPAAVFESLENWVFSLSNGESFSLDTMLAVGLHLQEMPPFGESKATSSGFVALGTGAGGVVPLPSPLLLLGSGLAGLAALGWRRLGR